MVTFLDLFIGLIVDHMIPLMQFQDAVTRGDVALVVVSAIIMCLLVVVICVFSL